MSIHISPKEHGIYIYKHLPLPWLPAVLFETSLKKKNIVTNFLAQVLESAGCKQSIRFFASCTCAWVVVRSYLASMTECYPYIANVYNLAMQSAFVKQVGYTAVLLWPHASLKHDFVKTTL